MKEKRIIEELAQNANQAFSEIKDGVLVEVDPRDVKDNQYTIPSEVTKIGYGAFKNCVLTAVTIGENVTEIGRCAFQGQEWLQKVKMGKNVTKIAPYAFYGCTSLMDVELNDKLKEIGEWAFLECSYLIHIPLPKNLEKVGTGAFSCTPIEGIIYRQFEKNKKAREEKVVAKK